MDFNWHGSVLVYDVVCNSSRFNRLAMVNKDMEECTQEVINQLTAGANDMGLIDPPALAFAAGVMSGLASHINELEKEVEELRENLSDEISLSQSMEQ